MLTHHGFPAPSQHCESAVRPRPRTAAEAEKLLELGHRRFLDWMSRVHGSQTDVPRATDLPQVDLIRSLFPLDRVPSQEPYAITLGCADARVPLRLLLGSTVNDLFEIRVAGQVLADECLGSVDYALHHLPSIKTIAILGHSDCGAVKATVDSYLKPCCLDPSELSVGLEAIVNHIFGSVVQAERALRATDPGLEADTARFRDRLLQVAIVVNAATIAHRLEFLIRQQGRDDVGVVFGVYDLQSHAIVHPETRGETSNWPVGFCRAPATTDSVAELALAAARAAGPAEVTGERPGQPPAA